MGRANLVLLVAAILYPFANFYLLRTVSGMSGIPSMSNLVVFTFVLPGFVVAMVVTSKLSGLQLHWGSVMAFAIWMLLIAWCNHLFINAIWNTI